MHIDSRLLFIDSVIPAVSSDCCLVGSRICPKFFVAQVKDDFKSQVMNLSFYSACGLVYFLSSPVLIIVR